MYIIIVGAGDIGTPLIELATEDGNEVVVIERDEDRAERASRRFDCLVIHDDARQLRRMINTCHRHWRSSLRAVDGSDLKLPSCSPTAMAFIVVFGAMNYLAFSQRDRDEVRAGIPLVGLIGTGVFLPLFGWHLYSEQFDIFVLVVGITVVLLVAEGLYFERELISEGIHTIEKRI